MASACSHLRTRQNRSISQKEDSNPAFRYLPIFFVQGDTRWLWALGAPMETNGCGLLICKPLRLPNCGTTAVVRAILERFRSRELRSERRDYSEFAVLAPGRESR